MTPSDILLLISLAVVVLWTTWLARAKGLNPWLWGAGTALLVVVAWSFGRQYLGLSLMAPLIFLLLFRSPLFRKNRAATGEPCPRCAATNTGGLNFCVQCGWDLSRPYASTGEAEAPAGAAPEATTETPPEMEPLASPAETTLKTAAATPVEPVAPPPEPVASQETTAAEPVLAQEAAPAPPATAEIPGAAAASPPARRIPTAASMTEQGIALFGQGRFQEAIDQFTKAIALDPKYRLAWERRAEAYGRLGRAEREAADKRQLEAI